MHGGAARVAESEAGTERKKVESSRLCRGSGVPGRTEVGVRRQAEANAERRTPNGEEAEGRGWPPLPRLRRAREETNFVDESRLTLKHRRLDPQVSRVRL